MDRGGAWLTPAHVHMRIGPVNGRLRWAVGALGGKAVIGTVSQGAPEIMCAGKMGRLSLGGCCVGAHNVNRGEPAAICIDFIGAMRERRH